MVIEIPGTDAAAGDHEAKEFARRVREKDSTPLTRDEIINFVFAARNALLTHHDEDLCVETLTEILDSPDAPEENLAMQLRRVNGYIGRASKLLVDATEQANELAEIMRERSASDED